MAKRKVRTTSKLTPTRPNLLPNEAIILVLDAPKEIEEKKVGMSRREDDKHQSHA